MQRSCDALRCPAIIEELLAEQFAVRPQLADEVPIHQQTQIY